MRMLSPIASIARGSLAGLTFLANQYHQIVVRARTAPVDPSTTNQAAIRSGFTSASATWDGLTSLEREEWESWSRGIQLTGPLGKYTIPGRLAFMAGRSMQEYINTRALVAVSFVTSAPLPNFRFKLANVAPSTPSGAPGTIAVAISATNQDVDDGIFLVQISRAFNDSRQRFKGPFSSIDVQAVRVVSLASALIQFEGLVEGAIYFVRVRAVADDASPRVSAEMIIRTTAVAIGP